jgi:phosphoglycerol transferase MdoB-like AlkP superfamily enzyme
MLMRFVAYAGAFWMLSEGFVETVFTSSANLVAYTLFAAGATTLIATGADQHAQHNHHEKPLGWLDAISWLLIIGAAMPMLKENRFGLGAMLSSGIISVLVSATIVSLIFSSVSLARGSITVLAGFVLMTLTGAFVQVGTQDFISVPAALLLATLPLVVLIPLHTPSGIKRLITRAALIIAIAGGAAYFVYIHNDSSADTGSDDQYQSTEDYYESLDQ